MNARFRFLLPLTLLLTACPGNAGPSVGLKGHHYWVEVMSDDAGRERGLMFREQMDADHGMLFVFNDDQGRSFWMKNTRIPLDILYFDAQGRFVSGQYRVPPCMSAPCPTYDSTGPARYVLELNAGVGAKLGLVTGDVITLPAR